MPLPVCVKCRREMRCEKNSFAVVDSAGVWDGDEYACPGCGVEVVVGFGAHPYVQPHETGFNREIARVLLAGEGLRLEEQR